MQRIYNIRRNYIEDINIFQMPFINFYDMNTCLLIKPSIKLDSEADFSFRNDIPDINKIRFPKRLQNIYDVKRKVCLDYSEEKKEYTLQVSHSIHDFEPISLIPNVNESIKYFKIGKIKQNEKLVFEFPEKIVHGAYIIKIFSNKRKFISFEPIQYQYCDAQEMLDNIELQTEYGQELNSYPYDSLQFICTNIKRFHLYATMMQKLKWSVYNSNYVLYRGLTASDGRSTYYIAEENSQDFLTGNELNKMVQDTITGFVSEKTKQNQSKLNKTYQAYENDRLQKEHMAAINERMRKIRSKYPEIEKEAANYENK